MSCLTALEEFFNRYHDFYQQALSEAPRFYPLGENSDCIIGDYDGDLETVVQWKPFKRKQNVDFSNVESALSISLHHDINEFYGCWFSGHLFFDSKWGHGELLQPWNQSDFELLQQNTIGHLMMKQKLKQPLTWFVGVLEEGDQMITVNNEDGSVWLETPGEIPTQKLSDSISELLKNITPRVTPAEKPQSVDEHIEHPGIFSSFKRMWNNLRGKA
ncbi:SecY-interacting protein [Parashewanella curva]|uniref:Protein Syd n=1 Tax=Parashewanella curva TaxID=2338552 RepID=A0A3L8PR64_9GAMM|nr:SecY-interacting protein [Parashewanella curva]RLV57870.1 SecY-interacting protein [Parashewanella curva]